MKKSEVQRTREIFALNAWERAVRAASPFLSIPPLPSDAIRRHMVKNSYKTRNDRGDKEAIFECIEILGEKALEETWVLNRIASWRKLLLEPHPLKGIRTIEAEGKRIVVDDAFCERAKENARQCLLRVGGALAAMPKGRRELTPEERKQRKRESNREAQRTRRAVAYCVNAWKEYEKRKQKNPGNGRDPKWLRQLANSIDQESFSRNSPAKSDGRRQFQEKVEQDIAVVEAAVRKNST